MNIRVAASNSSSAVIIEGFKIWDKHYALIAYMTDTVIVKPNWLLPNYARKLDTSSGVVPDR
jgi:hypothetical protein